MIRHGMTVSEHTGQVQAVMTCMLCAAGRRGYDSQTILNRIETMGVVAVMPFKPNRKNV